MGQIGECYNELSQLLWCWQVCLLQQTLHHSKQMSSNTRAMTVDGTKGGDRAQGGVALAVRPNISFSMRSIFIYQLTVFVNQFLKKEKEWGTLIMPLSGLNPHETPARAADKACKPSVRLVDTPGLNLTLITRMTAEKKSIQILSYQNTCQLIKW